MNSSRYSQQKDTSIAWLFIAPALLLLAHVMTGIALLFFGWRVGDLPLNPLGLGVYLTTTVTLGILFLVGAKRAKPEWPLTSLLLLISVPTFISLALSAALWLTGWLGNAPYAPWKPGDTDIVIFLSLLFLFSWIVIAILYGSYGYLLVGGMMQIAVYFAAHALPHWSRYPEASPLGVQPGFPIQLIGWLVLGGFLVALRKRVVPDFQPTLWVAVVVLTAVGSFTLFIALNQFPENGMVLGWTGTPTTTPHQVPNHAWNWTRPVAQSLTLLAAFCCASRLHNALAYPKAKGDERETAVIHYLKGNFDAIRQVEYD